MHRATSQITPTDQSGEPVSAALHPRVRQTRATATEGPPEAPRRRIAAPLPLPARELRRQHLTGRSSTVPGHGSPPGTARRVHARARPRVELQREHVLQRLRPGAEVGGWFRCGNRANEGYAEMTVCLYLPDGRVAFMFKRPEIVEQRRLRRRRHPLRGASSPFERLDVSLHRQGRGARRPAPDGRPQEGLHREPLRRVRGAHRVHRRVGHVRRRARRAAREAGRGVRQGPLRAAHRRQGHRSASATRSGRSTASACATTRGAPATGRRPGTTAGSPPTSATTSASWAPASPAATATAPAAASCGRTASSTSATTSRSRPTWVGDDTYHRGDLAPSLRSGDKEWKVTGKVLDLIPLRNRRPDPDGNMLVTRISEGMTEWTLERRPQGLRPVRVPRPDHRRRARRQGRVAHAAATAGPPRW